MRYSDFSIRPERSGASYSVTVISPCGEARGSFDLGQPLEQVWGYLPGLWRDVVRHQYPRPGSLHFYGSQLFASIFHSSVYGLLEQSLSRAERSGEGLRIQIEIDPWSPTEILDTIVWEALRETQSERCLALDRSTPVVRHYRSVSWRHPAVVNDRLKILLISSAPPDLGHLNLEREQANLEVALGDASAIELVCLANPTIAEVGECLARHEFHILHYMGMASSLMDGAGGALVFGGRDGGLDLVSGGRFAEMLRGQISLRLAFLNACDTARVVGVTQPNPFRSTALSLILSGVPAVIAMQFPISDRAAIAFSSVFYRRLAAGDALESAVTEGRHAILLLGDGQVEWVTPVLFSSFHDGILFERARREDSTQSRPRLRVFICHASEDKPEIRKLHRRLQIDGYQAWLDEVDILPGKRWKDEILRALRQSEVILVCLSNSAVTKTGFLQRELGLALDLLNEHPEDDIFLIPVRLERCQVPERLKEIQFVDLFEEDGYAKLITALGTKAKVQAGGRGSDGTA